MHGSSVSITWPLVVPLCSMFALIVTLIVLLLCTFERCIVSDRGWIGGTDICLCQTAYCHKKNI